MKRLILLLAIGFTAINAFAVTHANIWNIFQYRNDAFVTQGSIRTYSIRNDTIIDGVKYFQVDKYNFRYNEDSTRVYVHIDENMLHMGYASNPDSANIRTHMIGNDMLFYAYDVQANDTLYTLALSGTSWVRCNVVQSVADNNGRKQIEIKYVHRAMYETNSVEENDTWLEGVGSLVGLYCDPLDIAPITYYALFCASFDDERIYRINEEKYKSFYKEFGIISPCHEDVIDAVENVSKDTTANKVLIDGQLYIIRNEEIFTITGQNVK